MQRFSGGSAQIRSVWGVLPKQISVQVPAELEHLRIARTLVRSAAAGWGIDRLEDLTLAMDEAAELLIEAKGGDVLDIGIESLPHELAVTMSRSAPELWPPPSFANSLDEVIFRGLVDTVQLRKVDDAAVVVLRIAR